MTWHFDSRMARALLWSLVAALLAAGCATHAPPAPRAPAYTPTPEYTRPRHAPPPVGKIDPASQRCLALAMYWEARGEGQKGMEAVGAVVLNRVADPRFPNTVCGVVYQGGEKPPCQFSWWCDGRSDRPTHREVWNSSLALASQLLTGSLHDPTRGALYFSQKSIRQPPQRVRTAQIGNHAFYR
jgi:spore germination cell wall hydrolase CwlJ-like protein